MDGDIENVLCGRDFLESKQNGGPRKNAQEKYIIDIRCIGDGDPLEFEVVIRQQDSETTHRVRMTREMYRRLTAGKHTPEHFLDAHSASCSMASRRKRSLVDSILGSSDATFLNLNGSYRIISQSTDLTVRWRAICQENIRPS
jgi:hypothetical protein